MLDNGKARFVPSAEAAADSFAQADAGVTPDVLQPSDAIEDTAPEATAKPIGSGMASYYGRRFAGRATASGERFDPAQLTAAHRTLPFGSLVRVTNQRNGRSVVVRINDRGPYAHGREIDLSRGAAEEIGLVAAGHGRVDLALVSG